MDDERIDLEPIVQKAGGRGGSPDEYDAITARLVEWHGDLNTVEVPLARIGKCYGSALLSQNRRGLWLAGYNVSHPAAGGQNGPSVWHRWAWRSREAAVAHAVEQVRAFFEREATSWNSCVSEATRRDAATLAARLAKPVVTQTTLFDLMAGGAT